MTDCYTHLQLAVPDPLADLRSCMAEAGVSEAVVVETLDGQNRGRLDRIAGAGEPGLRIVYCGREGMDYSTLDKPNVAGLRLCTGQLLKSSRWAGHLRESGKALVVHAEHGIGGLAPRLREFAADEPGIPVFVPHMGWPRRDGRDDPDWARAIRELSGLATVSIGISGIAHFSSEAFPHPDMERTASRIFELFGPARVAVASDYPASCAGNYAGYLKLARSWICSRWPDWRQAECLTR